MDLAVIHTIHDHDGWRRALAEEHAYGPGYDLRSFVQAVDGSRAVCLWDAPDADGLRERLDRFFGTAAVNDVFRVEVADLGPAEPV